MLLYFGPEVMMPLASAGAAAVGAVLMFWRRFVGGLKAVVRSGMRLLRRDHRRPVVRRGTGRRAHHRRERLEGPPPAS